MDLEWKVLFHQDGPDGPPKPQNRPQGLFSIFSHSSGDGGHLFSLRVSEHPENVLFPLCRPFEV